MTHQEHIEARHDVLGGKPVVRGTRVPVSLILNLLANGYTVARIVEAYPVLTTDDVLAAVEYAEHVISRERVIDLPRIAHA